MNSTRQIRKTCCIEVRDIDIEDRRINKVEFFEDDMDDLFCDELEDYMDS